MAASEPTIKFLSSEQSRVSCLHIPTIDKPYPSQPGCFPIAHVAHTHTQGTVPSLSSNDFQYDPRVQEHCKLQFGSYL